MCDSTLRASQDQLNQQRFIHQLWDFRYWIELWCHEKCVDPHDALQHLCLVPYELSPFLVF